MQACISVQQKKTNLGTYKYGAVRYILYGVRDPGNSFYIIIELKSYI